MIYLGNQTACWAATPREPFDFAVASGFDAFEWFPDKKADGGGWDEHDLDSDQRRNIRELAQARGIRLSVHARWQANPLQPESAALFERDIVLAREVGAVLLNIHLYHERGIAAYVEAIRPLIRRVTEAGLRLAIENTPHHSPEDFNELFAQLRRLDPAMAANVGMCFDLGHANLCSATHNDYLGFLDRLAPSVPIIHLHLHENYGDADTHLPLFTGPSGRNDAGIRGMIARLRDRQFTGAAIFEQWPNPPSLLKQARDRLTWLLEQIPEAPVAPPPPPPVFQADPALVAALDDFARRLVEGDQRSRSWRQKLDSVRALLAGGTAPLTTEQLVDTAIYLRFLGTGQIPCAEDGRHFRPAHHARIALEIQERLAALSRPETAFILRRIYPWLPSSAREFQRAEPLTRIRDIAHRNDIPAELKREIKDSLQNKLHRCAGPEDLATSAALLARITAPGAGYAPEFVEQFRVFHEELKEFFNARSLDERLQALLPAASSHHAALIREFLAAKARPTLAGQLNAFQTLTELRRGLLNDAERLSGAEQQECLLADIGLEDFAFALLSGIFNALEAAGANTTGAAWTEILELTLTNLALSRVEPEECAAIGSELRAWCAAFDPADREHWLRLMATVSRARRLAESYSDRILAWFPPRALRLGQALGVPETAARIFGEAEIRGHLIFQLSKLASCLLRRVRGELALPAWDVVVSGQVAGRVTGARRLDGNFPEPVLVLLQQAVGDEEIPAGVAGIVLAHDLPHLSHLGVRARQAGVVLVACEESARFDELKQLAGKFMSLVATAEKVTWQPDEAVRHEICQRQVVQIPQVCVAPESSCLALDQATAKRGGNKAEGMRRLAELAHRAGAGFQTPPALVVPFGVLEEALRTAPQIEAEYRRILASINTASEGLPVAAERLRQLIQQLAVPAPIVAGVAAKFSGPVRLMARSSANDEDLKQLAGAGLYDSIANVPPTEIAAAVRDVWASLWTRRAVLSRQQAGIPQAQAHMAVLIQRMLVPDLSFILHTVNPVSQQRNETYAEVVVGLGETLASAAARGNPYRFLCEKHAGAVTTLAFASFSDALWPHPAGGVLRRCVDYSHVPLSRERAARERLGRRLAAIAQFVEAAFQGPQDIEGVVVGDEIYLVQARPQQGLKEPQ